VPSSKLSELRKTEQNMENAVNFAVPWEDQEPKSFQLQGASPLTPCIPLGAPARLTAAAV